MKNKSILNILNLLGQLNSSTAMYIKNGDEYLKVGAMLMNDNTIYLCKDYSLCLNANSYIEYLNNEYICNENLNNISDLDVKVYTGNILFENPFESENKENIKEIRSIAYKDKSFLFSI